MERIVPREGRGGRADLEARIWMAEHVRTGRRDRPQIPLLLVSPFQDDHAALLSILRKPDFCLFRSRGLQQALAVLRRASVPVVVAECNLQGCCWKDVWTALQGVPHPPLPRLIVAASRADECLWNEVVHLGAYDVLAKPFESEEVVSVVTSAWEHWRWETEAASAHAGKQPMVRRFPSQGRG